MKNVSTVEKLTEITKCRTRTEEEKFYVKFSETQLNAVLLLILGNTFFVQGASKFLENNLLSQGAMKLWFIVVIVSLLFLVFSVVTITLGGVLNHLKLKRIFNLLSFMFFVLGIFLFIGSLFYLLSLLMTVG